jgi:hypothetical protein
MIYLLAFLIVVTFAILFLWLLWVIFQAVICFPIKGMEHGWRYAYEKYFSCIIVTALFFIFEFTNLTGFSWSRMQYVSDDELIEAAIQRAYPDIYKNKTELKKDYSKFQPQVRYWGSWSYKMDNDLIDKLLGFTRYQVLLPDTVVILDVEGKALFTELPDSCFDSGCKIAPDNPEQGIVGTVQLGPPDYLPASKEDLSIVWDGEISSELRTWGDQTKDNVLIKNHCFSAYIKSAKLHKLKIKARNQDMVSIKKGYGFYLVTIKEPHVYSSMRISKEAFLKSQKCDLNVRKEWPKVGGASWLR